MKFMVVVSLSLCVCGWVGCVEDRLFCVRLAACQDPDAVQFSDQWANFYVAVTAETG